MQIKFSKNLVFFSILVAGNMIGQDMADHQFNEDVITDLQESQASPIKQAGDMVPGEKSAPKTKFFTDDKPSEEAPVVVGLFMVWNEEQVIQQTLEPYVKGGINHFFIFGGGISSDKTMEVAKSYLESEGIRHFYLAEEAFEDFDFSVGRNRALDLAREKFPKSAFLLFPDAGWTFHNVPGLLEFCKQHVEDVANWSYLVRIMNDNTDFKTPRLIRTKSLCRFYGDPHEVPLPPTLAEVPGDVYFWWGFTEQSVQNSKKRWKNRDLPKMLKRFIQEPNNPRTVFYLAQTYDGLEDIENAYKFYELRTHLNHLGFPEENFVAAYRLAQVAEVFFEKNDPRFSWPVVLDLYLKAHSLRPFRAEPLVKIGERFWKDQNFPLAFFFGRRAVELAYPHGDTLPIEKHLYEFQRYDLLGKSAYQIGECALGERATRILIKKYPRLPQLYRNLAAYLECDKKPSDLWGYNLSEPDLRELQLDDEEDSID